MMSGRKAEGCNCLKAFQGDSELDMKGEEWEGRSA
jgi:hypothetical protein